MKQETCCCDFPVNLQKARRVFTKAAWQAEKAATEFLPYLEERSKAIRASKPPLWIDYGYSYSEFVDLREDQHALSKLRDLAAGVTALRLTRGEVATLAHAERTDYYSKWAKVVAELKKEPFPEPYKESEETKSPYVVAAGLTTELASPPREKRLSLLQRLWNAL